MHFSAFIPRSSGEVGRFYRLLLQFVVIIGATFLFLYPGIDAYAQAPSSYQQENTVQANPYTIPQTNPDVPKNLHTWTQTIMIDVLSAMTCQLTGIDPTTKEGKCLGIDPKTQKIGFVENGGGAIGLMGHMIAELYTPPIHMYEYTDDMASNFGIAKTAYAQSSSSCRGGYGYGFCGISPLLSIWTAFRNIVYLIFTILFILVGLGIMLRIKIDPRAVMTVENQLPRLVIGLILITFSFAIVGFLIDMMYVSIYVVFNVFSDPSVTTPETAAKIAQSQKLFQGNNPIGFMNNIIGFKDIVTNASGGVKDIVQNMFYQRPNNGNIFLISGIADFWDNIRNGGGWILGVIFGTLGLMIIGGAVLWAMFRLWFALLAAYIYLLMDIVLAPFWIVLSAFPGSPANFESWIRDVLSNLAAFVVTIAMFLLGQVFIETFNKTGETLFVPPLIGNPNPDGTGSALAALIGMGIIFITPKALEITKETLKAPTFKYTSAIGEALGTGAGFHGTAVKNTIGTIQSQGEYIAGAGGAYAKRGWMKSIMGRVF